MLDKIGIGTVEFRDSGAKALGYINNDLPDLIVSALYLPDMTASEMLLTLQENRPDEVPAFILISSETRFEQLDPIKQSGVAAILTKPFGDKELRIALDSALETLALDQPNEDADEFDMYQVLLVDDSSLSRKQIHKLLNAIGIEKVFEAENGQQAISLIKESFFDLIISDYNMPEVDGCELVNFIRTQSEQSSVPVLMITSEQDESRLNSIQNAGVSAICDKPCTTSTIKRLIKQLLTE